MDPSLSPSAHQQPDQRFSRQLISTCTRAISQNQNNELGLEGMPMSCVHFNDFSSDHQANHRHINQYQLQIPINHQTSFSAIPLGNIPHQIFYHQSAHPLLHRTTPLINSLDLNLNQTQKHDNQHYLAKNPRKRIHFEDQDLQAYPSPDAPKKAKISDYFFNTTQSHTLARSFHQIPQTYICPSFTQNPIPLSPQSPFLPNVMPSRLPQSNMVFDPAETFDDLEFFPERKISSPVLPIQTEPPLPNPFKPIAVPKKPSAAKKEPTTPVTSLELPHTIESDNGKRSWELIKSIGKGGCGEVYLARELPLQQPTPFVAIKIIKDRKQFLSELATMKTLNDHEYGRGYTPKLIMALKKRKALVMEFLSDTISTRFERNGYHFSLKTICILALNMMSLVRDFNEKTGQAHVDIKPSNFCTSPNGRDLFLIDFGYSTPPHVKLPGQTGTPLFMACNLQTIGATYPSLQDDYESIGYVLMFLIGGGKKGLPWGSLRTHKDIASSKNDTLIYHFCQKLIGTEFEPLAQTLSSYLFLCRDRSKAFTNVEYTHLFNEWNDVLQSCGWSNDKNYDWVEQDSAFNSSLTLINSQSTSLLLFNQTQSTFEKTVKLKSKINPIKNTLRKNTV